MFREIRAHRLTGLLEVGELTCEKSERQLIRASHSVGADLARAIDFILRAPEAAVLNTRKFSFGVMTAPSFNRS